VKRSRPLRRRRPLHGRPSRTEDRPRSRIPTDAVDAVLRRSGGRCEARATPGCSGRWEHLHHRRLRSQGGGHDAANLLAVCHFCHRWIHDHPAESYARGWLVRAGTGG